MCARLPSTSDPTELTVHRRPVVHRLAGAPKLSSLEHTIERVDRDDDAPAVGWASGPLGGAQAADREIARQTAVRARALAAFAVTRPASADRPPGQPGCMSADRRAARPEVLAEVSEWAAEEVALALSLSSRAAENELVKALTLVHR